MRGTAEHAVNGPENMQKGFASGLKSAHDDSSEGNGSEHIDNVRLLSAIDSV